MRCAVRVMLVRAAGTCLRSYASPMRRSRHRHRCRNWSGTRSLIYIPNRETMPTAALWTDQGRLQMFMLEAQTCHTVTLKSLYKLAALFLPAGGLEADMGDQA